MSILIAAVSAMLAADASVSATGAREEQGLAASMSEQRAACAALGVDEVVFLGHDDGQLQATLELRRELVRVIRQYKPEVVLCGDPTRMFFGDDYINHPDHRAGAQAALDAVAPASGMPLLWPELGEPHSVRQVYIQGNDKPNVWVDIAETIELKIAALREHRSQVGEADIARRMRQWAAEDGKERGLAFAETYRVMVLVNEP